MNKITEGINIKADFEAPFTAALMIQSNALIPFKLAKPPEQAHSVFHSDA